MNFAKLKEGKLEKILGVVIIICAIGLIVGIRSCSNREKVMEVYAAVGGGKEALLADEEINAIFEKEYKFKFVGDTWSNNKMVAIPLVREKDQRKYDLAFFSDQRYYDYYKKDPVGEEAKRDYVVAGGLTLNTPIVIYSWDSVVDVLIKHGIVTVNNDIYYITNMNKLIDYIIEGKKWGDLGLNDSKGEPYMTNVGIGSTDPVSSSPGATYYGLLLSVLTGGDINNSNIETVLPKLKQIYKKSNYMTETPADLFDNFLHMGVGNYNKMIVDYEKSIVDFKVSNPDGWNQIKDKIRILYPTPTVVNSHCIAAFNDNGKKVVEAFKDKNVAQLSWEKHGFRVGMSSSNVNVSKLGIKGIPSSVDDITSGFQMETYRKVVEYLGN